MPTAGPGCLLSGRMEARRACVHPKGKADQQGHSRLPLWPLEPAVIHWLTSRTQVCKVPSEPGSSASRFANEY